MVVGFTTTFAISACHHWCCEFESRSGRGVQHYVIKFVRDLRQVGVFSAGTPVSSTNKTDCHDITEILLKVALNTIKQTNKIFLTIPLFLQLYSFLFSRMMSKERILVLYQIILLVWWLPDYHLSLCISPKVWSILFVILDGQLWLSAWQIYQMAFHVPYLIKY
jgi:hypothetical protein